jgi:hypothetical protein
VSFVVEDFLRDQKLNRQLLEQFFPQLLSFPEMLLVLHKHPVEFQRLIG